MTERRPVARTISDVPYLRPVPEADHVAQRRADESLIVDLEGYEGPLDLLLTLARVQKVDLMKISVLHLAEQYLAFVEQARALRIELAADYLVMAAFQLERLWAMRQAAAQLMARERLGISRFPRGTPETVARTRRTEWRAGLIDLMRAYARLKTRSEFRPYAFDRRDVFTMEQALDRLRGMIGYVGDWTDLSDFLPDGWGMQGTRRRSATAATFAASLELARQGRIEIRQSDPFAPIRFRRKSDTSETP